MTRILDTMDSHVTLGVLDKDAHVVEHLKSVTFLDDSGTAHTVFAHVDGPFRTAEEMVTAWLDGYLHTQESHDIAARVAEDRDDREFANTLRKLAPAEVTATTTTTNGA